MLTVGILVMFLFRVMLAVSLLKNTFIMFRFLPYIPTFPRTFIMKGFWILSKTISISDESIIWFFLNLPYLDYIYQFMYVEPSLHLCIEAYLITADKLFGCVLGFSLQIFYLKFLHICSYMTLVCNFLSFLGLYVVAISG